MNPRALFAGICYLVAGLVSMLAFVLLLRYGLFEDALCDQQLCTPAADWTAFVALGTTLLALTAAGVGVWLYPELWSGRRRRTAEPADDDGLTV